MWVEEDTYILDTPGFSSIELFGIEKEELGGYFPEIAAHAGNCRFRGCAHLAEPDCAVKEAVDNGEISKGRYENYQLLYEDLKKRRDTEGAGTPDGDGFRQRIKISCPEE